jgi:iron complex outermembrane receptor protein
MTKHLQIFKGYIIAIISLLTVSGAFAQGGTVTGTVTDNLGPIPGATVQIEGTTTGTVTDMDGKFEVKNLADGSYTMVARYIGYNEQTQSVIISGGNTMILDFSLIEGIAIDELVVVGSRNKPRSLLATTVPVDIISEKAIERSPQVETGQILQYLAPSFHSTQQTISDGTDHIDPASLRGLGPDQTLVLVNGKRRHTTSLINVNGTVGRGTVGTDLNSIPANSIKRIEVLRDGASAQYGSDAIAGVINIELKDNAEFLAIDLIGGASYEGDGEKFQVNGNFGSKLGERGFINFSAAFTDRNSVNRSGNYTGTVYGDSRDDDPQAMAEFYGQTGYKDQQVMEIGASAYTQGAVALNADFAVSENSDVYFFGTLNSRQGLSHGFYRFPKDSNKVIHELYPDGFTPEIQSDVNDNSFGIGLKGEKNHWNYDFSFVNGRNRFDFTIKNSNNASLGPKSPLVFSAGGFKYSNIVNNFDISRYFDFMSGTKGLGLSFGYEFRIENYIIKEGEEASYINGGYVNGTVAGSAGAQVFPGFQPQNALNKLRNNVGIYTDIDWDITKSFLLNAAVRFENYSDFGENFSWKASARYMFGDNFTIRAAASTGFRAPSLHQYYFSSLSTQFVEGQAIQVGTFNNESPVSRAFGIDPLKAETSFNFSGGFTGRLAKGLSLTVDYYNIQIQDRIVLTGRFSGAPWDQILDPLGAGSGQFFANAVNTTTWGIDAVINYKKYFDKSQLDLTFGYNFNSTKVDEINVPQKLLDIGNANGISDSLMTTIYFNREEVSRLEVATPKMKLVSSISYDRRYWGVMVRGTYFGVIEYINPSDGNPANWQPNALDGDKIETRDQLFSGKFIVDLSFDIHFTKNITLTLGANNLLNTYPDKHTHSSNVSSGRFVYSRRVQQFGVLGGYYYGKLAFLF